MDFPARLTAHLGSAARVSAWICVAATAYLSLVPHSMEIRTPLPGGVEHAIAYAGTAVLLKLGYPHKALFVIASALFAYSGVLAVLQTFVGGRHSGVIGALERHHWRASLSGRVSADGRDRPRGGSTHRRSQALMAEAARNTGLAAAEGAKAGHLRWGVGASKALDQALREHLLCRRRSSSL